MIRRSRRRADELVDFAKGMSPAELGQDLVCDFIEAGDDEGGSYRFEAGELMSCAFCLSVYSLRD